MLYIAFGMSFLGAAVGSGLALFLLKKPLRAELELPITACNAPKAGKRTAVGKRVPRALTDSMAYQREIEEEGQNRT